jgi:uncharacterized surface protein with fasciclin (FAS1) repeats
MISTLLLAAAVTVAPLPAAGSTSVPTLAAPAPVVYGPPAPSAAQGLPTILEAAAAAGNFNTLAAALNAADLVGTLSGPGPFTVFAPTDAAFGTVPPGRLAYLLNPANKARLQTLLTYHVVPGNLDSTAVLGSPFLTTVSGQRAVVDAQALTIDGVQISSTDIICSNGIIHVLDGVMFPELRTVTGMAATTPDFSTLFTALQVAGLDDDLEAAGPFTVFAPTNAAFAALPPGVLDSLINDPNALGNVLLYHATPGRLYAEDVLAQPSFTMLNGGTTTITANASGAFINGAQITVTDVEVWNGVIHVIDAVLVPGP